MALSFHRDKNPLIAMLYYITHSIHSNTMYDPSQHQVYPNNELVSMTTSIVDPCHLSSPYFSFTCPTYFDTTLSNIFTIIASPPHSYIYVTIVTPTYITIMITPSSDPQYLLRLTLYIIQCVYYV